MSILSKGLKFCPTQNKVNAGDVRKELDTFHNKLRTTQFFNKEGQKDQGYNTTQTNHHGGAFADTAKLRKIKDPSNWRAPTGSPALETFINLNEITLGKTSDQKIKKQNITKAEREAIKNLSKDNSITIKPADKGGAVVILNTSEYVAEAERQLRDTNTYQSMKKDRTNETHVEVNTLIDQMVENKEITSKVGGILRVKKVRTPHIYFLPKIHKEKRPPPGRPIISANGCATEKISAFVDIFLRPLVKETKSHVTDTSDFIQKIRDTEKTLHGTIIGTMDVTSLYTNIPNDEGIQNIGDVLTTDRNSREKPTNQTLIKLLEVVLKNNNLQFNGDHYLQIGGTAMGTKVAPSYANLYMRVLEEKLLEAYHLKPTTWYRYIDDIFFIWNHGEESLKDWITYLNNAHPTIKFTAEYSTKSIHFLDTTVKIDSNQNLYTDLYCKPTDSHNYLRYNSAHPPRNISSLPYSQFLRLKRICTKDEHYKKHSKTMKKHFIEKGYPKTILNKAIDKCTEFQQADLLTAKKKQDLNDNDAKPLFLVNTFRPCKNSLTMAVKTNWPILGRSKTTKDLYRSRLMTSYKRPKNLREQLVRARTDYKVHTGLDKPEENENLTKTINECKKANCKYCNMLDKDGQIKNHITGRQHVTKHNVTCNSSNLIYCIECKKCNIQYVGQTKRKIKERLREHMYNIKKKVHTSDVTYHFNLEGHSTDDMKVYITDFIYEHPDSQKSKNLRTAIEFNWIHRLQSQAPTGLNTLDNRYG